MVPQKKGEGVRLFLHLARGVAQGVLYRSPDDGSVIIGTQRNKDTASILGWSQSWCPDTGRLSTHSKQQQCCPVPLQGEGGGGRGDGPADRGEGGEDPVGEQVWWAHHGHHHLQALHLPCLGPALPCTCPAPALSCLWLEVLWITCVSMDFRPRHVRVKSWDK